MSLGEVLRVESVLFTARNKLIGADFSERASERERERESYCNGGGREAADGQSEETRDEMKSEDVHQLSDFRSCLIKPSGQKSA